MEVLAQDNGGGGGAAFAIVVVLIGLAAAVVQIAGLWKMFEKGGIPGWWAIVPIANGYFFVQLSGKEWWWFLLFFVPCINLIAAIVVTIAVAERFGKSIGYAIGMIFLPIIFYPLLGFGDAEYRPAVAV